MHVLIVGGGGFIGRHIAGRLVAEGVRVTTAGRVPARLERLIPGASALTCDLSRDTVEAWRGRLAGVDAVINCAGLFGDARGYPLVHAFGPAALFDACRLAGVNRVVQVSALGAHPEAASAYHRSKGAADDHLAALDPTGSNMGWVVLRPSLVIGRGGRSSALFAALAALPVTPHLGRAGGLVQPIHIDDLIEVVVRLLHAPLPLAERLDIVGPEPMTTDALTACFRQWLGLPSAWRVTVPPMVLAAIARFGAGPVTREGMGMLAAGNTAPFAPLVAATGYLPAPLDRALARRPASEADLQAARFVSVAPILRLMLALVWLAGGIVPLVLTPEATSAAWLTRVGLIGIPATTALWAGSLADIAIGLALLTAMRGAALAGIGLMAVYTLILAGMAPELWADPFGALVKNAAVLGLSLAVHTLETRRG
ncbi:SDR family oxidoreductase [Sphingomonas sp. H39-1-10]|uniref:SDR family oxidoreductase n=1 Tax=Sphingomonas pollutisoli TaxID=3030829 RepID=UPI0023B8A2BA|nr:SDR family oxidoreductase [Sphingomonas pollutisoli]MDF0486501.1 SDR family oxidoreductase [Sphingomonas pollutisoli]